MLRRPSPRLSRHLVGVAFSLGVAVSASYSVLATQPNTLRFPVLMAVKLTVSDSKGSTTTESTEILVTSSETTVYMPGTSPTSEGYRLECGTTAPSSPASGDGHMRLNCTVSKSDAVVWAPSLLLTDDKAAEVESVDAEHDLRYTLELTASMSKGRLAAQSRAVHQS